MPEYSLLREQASREPLRALDGLESGAAFDRRYRAIRALLDAPERRPDIETPLFTELAPADRRGLISTILPDTGTQCVLVFSSPLRAADYSLTVLGEGPPAVDVSSTARQLFEALHELAGAQVDTFTLDRCPRCRVFGATDIESLTTPADLITLRNIHKATELARLEAGLDRARREAQAGDLVGARDIALGIVGHTGPDDPRPHELLGQLALELGDRALYQESRAFLRFLAYGRTSD